MGITNESLKVINARLKKGKNEEINEKSLPVKKKPKYKNIDNNRG